MGYYPKIFERPLTEKQVKMDDLLVMKYWVTRQATPLGYQNSRSLHKEAVVSHEELSKDFR